MELWIGTLTMGLVVMALATGGPVTDKEERQAVLRAARELMKVLRFCTMVTVDEAGTPQARAMEPFPPEDDLTVWMGTHRSTRKVAQLGAGADVTLLYLDAEGPGYVALTGSARLVDDLEERRARWNPAWEPFYPGGPEDPSYVLIELRPRRVELISNRHGIANDPLGWKPAIVEVG